MDLACPVFFSNQPDNNHCLQAGALIILNTLGRRTDWSEIDRRTGYKTGLYTWSVSAASALAQVVPGTKFISEWNYARFAVEGQSYLRQAWGPGWFALQERHATPGFEKEQVCAEVATREGLFMHQTPSAEEVESLMLTNFIIALVNHPTLYGSEGQSAHYVVVFGSDAKHFYLHDPGPPPRSAQKIARSTFVAAFRREMIVVPHPGFRFGLHTGRHALCYCQSGKKFSKCHGKLS
jgi:uncharacterized protein YchJ